MSRYFNRAIRVELGLRGEKPLLTYTDLRMTFNITKRINELASTATLEIYNLSADSQQKIAEMVLSQPIQLTISAGYEDIDGQGQISEIFKGTVGNFQGYKQPPETVSVFYAGTRLGDNEAPTQMDPHTFPKGTNRLDQLRWIIANTEGQKTLTVKGNRDFGRIAKAITYTKTTEQHLKEWARDNKCNYTIEGSQLVVERAEEGMPAGNMVTISPQTGMIGSPSVTAQGVNLDTVIRPEIKPLDWITVDTSNALLDFDNPFFITDRQFVQRTPTRHVRVLSITYQGDTHSDAWLMNIEGHFYYGT